MKTTTLKTTIVAALLLSILPSMAEEASATTARESVEKEQNSIQMLAELGSGVHKVKTDDNNVFKSCVVVGQSRISTVLGSSKGLEVARRNAKLKAEAEFVSWLKTHTSSVRSSGDETEFTLKGDGNNKSESGTSSETSTESITSSAQGAVRGLTLIGSHHDPETKMLTQVYAWKPDYARIADQIEDAMKPVDIPAREPAANNASNQPNQSKGLKKKTIVSPEAAEFL
ncbi:MAG: hypothetical protein J6Q84_00875 [Kiritimatiellae bacterium]|nr:hypothetical protein [Kiritimatiellia bacterium]